MMNLKAVEGFSVRPAPCLAVAALRSHYQQRNYLRLTFAPNVGNAFRFPSTVAPHHEILSRACRRSACIEGRLGAENASLGNLHRKEREARIRKELQQVTVSPSAYDTAWVSMVPLPGFPQAPRFPQCTEWILGNQNDDGSWGNILFGSAVSKDILLSTLACVTALKKWNLGEEQMRRGLHFIGRNFSIVMDKQIAAPIGFSLIFPGMLSLTIAMGLESPPFQQADVDEILQLRVEELERLSMEKSAGTKEYIAYVSEGLADMVDWSEVMKFQRKNGSLFNSLSTTAALLVHGYDDKALQFLSSVVGKFGGAVPTMYPLNIHCQLSMVDSLEKIGISHHFSSEITSIMDITYSLWLQKDEEIMLDFVTCSIAFRLLRMKGYGVSPDDLSHVSVVSSFDDSFQGYLNDTKCLLELYKASQVTISKNENILENIGYWSHSLLVELPLDEEIEYALKFPFYTTLERLDHRRNIENFDARDSQMRKTKYLPCGINEDLLSLAVEDFTHSQSIYHDELVHIESWVKESRLDQLQFARQRVSYCYLCAAGSITDHEQADARISIAKNAILASTVDDFFDGGGSKEELEDLIELAEKWDEHYNDKLYSKNVKIVFAALYTTIKELASRIFTVQNCDVTEHLIETWLHVLRSMMIEAKWRINHYVPTIEEYTKNAVVSISAGPVALPTLYFVGHKLSKSIFRGQEYDELLRLTGTCTRLLNDIQGLERDEGSEGKLNSVSLLIHHSGGSISIEMAKMAIEKSIISTTRDLLRLVVREGSVIPRPCKEVFWKICKMPHFFYFETDGYSSPKKMVGAVNALIYEPLKLQCKQCII